MSGIDPDEPTTIPWPAEIVEKMSAAGLEISVGLELYDRLAAQTPAGGWDPDGKAWAGVPIRKSRNLPPRALLVFDYKTGTPKSYREDVDKPRPPKP